MYSTVFVRITLYDLDATEFKDKAFMSTVEAAARISTRKTLLQLLKIVSMYIECYFDCNIRPARLASFGAAIPCNIMPC